MSRESPQPCQKHAKTDALESSFRRRLETYDMRFTELTIF